MHIREMLDAIETLTENRKAKLQYTEEKVKGELDRVIVHLEGSDSAVATRLAKEYKTVYEQSKLLSAAEKELNGEAIEYALDYFDAADIALTRVLETASLTLTVSKQHTRNTEEFDLEGFQTEILKLLPQSAKAINRLISKFTSLKSVDVKPKLSVKIPTPLPTKGKGKGKVGESINEGLNDYLQQIQAFGAKLLAAYKDWGAKYDQKLHAIEQQYIGSDGRSMGKYEDELGAMRPEGENSTKVATPMDKWQEMTNQPPQENVQESKKS